MLEYHVSARRIDAQGGVATAKNAMITLDTNTAGRSDAFNPAELLLASVAACMIKGIERAMPMISFDLKGVEVHIHGTRQDNPPRLVSIRYELIVDTDESEQRLDLLHRNVRKYGTVSNTIAAAAKLEGTIRRMS